MLTGQNGILNRASEAKEKTGESEDLEYLQMKAYDAITSYYINGEKESESEYILKEIGKIDGIETNVSQGTVKYNGKTYDISEIIGNTDEQKNVEKNGLKQITAANVESNEDKDLLTEKDTDGNFKIRMIITEKTKDNGIVTAVIPNGFYYVTGKITDGLVISDKFGDDDNNSKGGNQFVWIPCNGGEAAYEKHIYQKSNVNDIDGSELDTGNGNWKTYYYRNYDDWTDTDEREIKESSVSKYGGFYIARYEAGEPSYADFYNDTDESTYWQSAYNYDTNEKYGVDNTNKLDESKTYINTNKSKDVKQQEMKDLLPVSKKNVPSWNFISQATSNTVSKNMYKQSKTVTSYLVDGIAWDTVTKWISDKGNNVVDSISWGNYYSSNYTLKGLYARHQYRKCNDNGYRWFPAYVYNYGTYEKNDERTEIATGSAKRNAAQNIYDFAGNMWEWTTEIGKHNKESDNAEIYAVIRGGSFNYGGDNNSACGRNGGNSAGNASVDVGFRVVLYIK